jgi:hypothetical protein
MFFTPFSQSFVLIVCFFLSSSQDEESDDNLSFNLNEGLEKLSFPSFVDEPASSSSSLCLVDNDSSSSSSGFTFDLTSEPNANPFGDPTPEASSASSFSSSSYQTSKPENLSKKQKQIITKTNPFGEAAPSSDSSSSSSSSFDFTFAASSSTLQQDASPFSNPFIEVPEFKASSSEPATLAKQPDFIYSFGKKVLLKGSSFLFFSVPFPLLVNTFSWFQLSPSKTQMGVCMRDQVMGDRWLYPNKKLSYPILFRVKVGFFWTRKRHWSKKNKTRPSSQVGSLFIVALISVPLCFVCCLLC